jgi:hypothetical protein
MAYFPESEMMMMMMMGIKARSSTNIFQKSRNIIKFLFM